MKKKKPTKKAVCVKACTKSCTKPRAKAKPKKHVRCADAPKKLTRTCSKAAFEGNVRHSICIAKKPQSQAVAIAYAMLPKGCNVKKRKK